jgi:hypothetical protein
MTTPVNVTTEIGTGTDLIKIVQQFESTQPVDQQAVQTAIAEALYHLGIRPKR